jgi:DNA-binding transcriptional LysR family regulator
MAPAPEAVSLNPALNTFLAIHRAGSVSAASASLHLSQPAVTRRLQALERQLGAPLFDRTPLGLRLSSAGEALLVHAERAVAAERDGLRAVAAHVDGSAGSVTIAVVGSLAGRWLSDVLAAVAAERPALDLVVSTATSRQIRDQVLRGDVAVGISYARPTDPDLEVTVAFDEDLVVVAAAGHPYAGRPVVLDELRAERWLMFPELPSQPETSGAIARNLLDRHQVPAERIRPIDSLSAQRALARAGYGLAFVPHSAIADDVAAGDLAVLDVVDARVVAPVTVMTRRGGYRSAATAVVLQHLGHGPHETG